MQTYFRLPLDAYQGYRTRKLSTFSRTHPLSFFTCICESSTHDFCVLPLQICKVKCDWFIRVDVMEIVLAARVQRRYFRWRQATAGNTSAFAGYSERGLVIAVEDCLVSSYQKRTIRQFGFYFPLFTFSLIKNNALLLN